MEAPHPQFMGQGLRIRISFFFFLRIRISNELASAADAPDPGTTL